MNFQTFRNALMLGVLGGATVLVAMTITQVANGGAGAVSLPQDYSETFTKYDSFDRRNPTEIAELYANAIAFADLDKLDRLRPRLPIGSVIVLEVHNAKLDDNGQPVLNKDGRRIKDGLKEIQVMSKCEACGLDTPQELRTGNWQFAVFGPDGKLQADRDTTRCMECHKPMYKRDYVFSFKRLPRN